jgi:hypothetical protein
MTGQPLPQASAKTPTEADWRTRFERAMVAQRAGDLLMLAEEAPSSELAHLASTAAQRTAAAQSDAPRQVLLFSGHLVDAPGRSPPRFPSSKVPAAATQLAQVLAELDAGPQDLALSQAAAGGDLLFIEACIARGVRCEVLLPFRQAEFIAQSIAPVSDAAQWQQRYLAALQKLQQPVRCMPDALGLTPAGRNAYERCNRWLLASAVAHGADKVRFICLWNGGGGDGPGGTQHMHDEVQRRGGRVWWIDTRTL